MTELDYSGFASIAVFLGLISTGFFLGVLVTIFIGLSEEKFTEHPSFGYILAAGFCIVVGLLGLLWVKLASEDFKTILDRYISVSVYLVCIISYLLFGRWWKRRKL